MFFLIILFFLHITDITVGLDLCLTVFAFIIISELAFLHIITMLLLLFPTLYVLFHFDLVGCLFLIFSVQ